MCVQFVRRNVLIIKQLYIKGVVVIGDAQSIGKNGMCTRFYAIPTSVVSMPFSYNSWGFKVPQNILVKQHIGYQRITCCGNWLLL